MLIEGNPRYLLYSTHTELSDQFLAQGTMKLAQSPAGIEPGSSKSKPDTFTTEQISVIGENRLAMCYQKIENQTFYKPEYQTIH